MDDIKELMVAAGDHTYFSAYTPDAFTLNTANNPVMPQLPKLKCYDTAEKARLLGLFSGGKGVNK